LFSTLALLRCGLAAVLLLGAWSMLSERSTSPHRPPARAQEALFPGPVRGASTAAPAAASADASARDTAQHCSWPEGAELRGARDYAKRHASASGGRDEISSGSAEDDDDEDGTGNVLGFVLMGTGGQSSRASRGDGTVGSAGISPSEGKTFSGGGGTALGGDGSGGGDGTDDGTWGQVEGSDGGVVGRKSAKSGRGSDGGRQRAVLPFLRCFGQASAYAGAPVAQRPRLPPETALGARLTHA